MSRGVVGGRAGRVASVSAGIATRPGAGGVPTPFARLVLDAVDAIPPGRVMTYGDVAEEVGAPRRHRAVGQVLAAHGHEVPWWRVVLATGHPNPTAPAEGVARLRGEGCPLARGGERVDLAAARWQGA